MPQSPILAGVETIRGLWEAAGAARLLLHHKVSTIVQEHGLLLRHGTLFSSSNCLYQGGRDLLFAVEWLAGCGGKPRGGLLPRPQTVASADGSVMNRVIECSPCSRVPAAKSTRVDGLLASSAELKVMRAKVVGHSPSWQQRRRAWAQGNN